MSIDQLILDGRNADRSPMRNLEEFTAPAGISPKTRHPEAGATSADISGTPRFGKNLLKIMLGDLLISAHVLVAHAFRRMVKSRA